MKVKCEVCKKKFDYIDVNSYMTLLKEGNKAVVVNHHYCEKCDKKDK